MRKPTEAFCDYCSGGPRAVKGSPFLEDVGKRMCSLCWESIKDQYWNRHEVYIPSFELAIV